MPQKVENKLSPKSVMLGFHQVQKDLGRETASLTAAAKSHQSCPALCNPIDGSPPGSHPWDSPGKNTGVGCHFLLQCKKEKSESEVSQFCPTLSDPVDCSLPGSSIHGISQARVLEWVAIAFSPASLNTNTKWSSLMLNNPRRLVHCHPI